MHWKITCSLCFALVTEFLAGQVIDIPLSAAISTRISPDNKEQLNQRKK